MIFDFNLKFCLSTGSFSVEVEFNSLKPYASSLQPVNNSIYENDNTHKFQQLLSDHFLPIYNKKLILDKNNRNRRDVRITRVSNDNMKKSMGKALCDLILRDYWKDLYLVSQDNESKRF